MVRSDGAPWDLVVGASGIEVDAGRWDAPRDLGRVPTHAALVVPGSWRTGAACRSASTHLPREAHIVAGDFESAVFAARIADIERVLRIALGLFVTPMLVLVGFAFVVVVVAPFR